MSPRAQLVALLVGALAPLGLACGAPADPVPAPAPAEGEAMCREHGVLEALCTKCNPALVPVFVKRGDWCAEHGLPESICPICHPERGGRPSAEVEQAVAEDEAPADGIRVRLADLALGEVIGLERAPVLAAPAARPLEVTATVTHDATRVVRVDARVAGVLRALAVDVGARVEAGAELATLESAELGGVEAMIVAARARVRLARDNLARSRALSGEGMSSRRALAEDERELADARAELARLESSLALVDGAARGTYRVLAPQAGVVTRREVSAGATVEVGAPLFELVDTSVVWAQLELPEAELEGVREGAAVELRVEALPGHAFSGTLTYLAPEVQPASRTVRGRVPLPNPEGLLRANMIGRASLTAERAGTGLVSVPRAAIQRASEVSLVFVALAPELFEGRRVTLGRDLPDGRVEVRGRLAVGEQVVTTGAFLLKTETLKSSIGAGCCADEGGR